MTQSDLKPLEVSDSWRDRLHAFRVRHAGLPPRRALRRKERDPRLYSPVMYTNGRQCMNCATPLYGKFCLECGQRDTDLRRPVWTFLLEFVDDVFSLDSRLLRSLGPLIVKPGSLSRRYVDGGRVSVLPPIRMLLVILVVFFLTLEINDVALVQLVAEPRSEREQAEQEAVRAQVAERLDEAGLAAQESFAEPTRVDGEEIATGLLEPGGESVQIEGELAENGDPQAQAEVIERPEFLALGDSVGVNPEFFQKVREGLGTKLINDDEWAAYLQSRASASNRDEQERQVLDIVVRMLHGINILAQDSRFMNKVFNQWLPRALVMLVPVLALFLWVFYWGRNSYYFNHLIFSLHLHAFMFLLLTALSLVIPRVQGDIGAAVFFLGMPLYTFIAMKKMYRQGFFRTLIKFVAVIGTYAVLLLVSLVGIMVFGLSTA